MRKKTFTALVIAAVTVLVATPALAQDATANDVQVVLDNIWVLMAAVLVIFMQAGFALVEAGLTRAKSVANIMMKNLMDFCVGGLAFFVVGYAIAFGGDFSGFGKVLGGGGWFLGDGAAGAGNLTLATFFIFQVAFAATAATIVSGAMAERTKFKSYLIYSLALTSVVYPIVVRWVWGGGWLAQLGTSFHDFAGSTVVHSVGGWAALMGALILGPRIGKFDDQGRARAIPGHSIPFAVLGVFILFIGWFGFNPGSELAADAAVSNIAVTTLLAGVIGGVFATAVIWVVGGKPDVAMAGNGVLAGLVGITAGCWVMSNVGALITGAVAGVLVVFSVLFFDRVKIDDPVGAVSVHGVCGAWGTIAVGLFASGNNDSGIKGLFYGGGADQLVSQIVGVIVVFVFVTVVAGILFMALKMTIGLRVPAEEEMEGLDTVEHGAPGYGVESAM